MYNGSANVKIIYSTVCSIDIKLQHCVFFNT